MCRTGNYAKRVDKCMAAVKEYLAVEILELAENTATDNMKSLIIPCRAWHLQLASGKPYSSVLDG